MTLDLNKIVPFRLKLEIEIIENFYNEVKWKLDENKESIEVELQKDDKRLTKEEQEQFIDFDIYREQDELEILLGKLVTVYIYSIFERNIKSIMRNIEGQQYSLSGTKKKYERCNWKCINRFFNDRISGGIETIQGYYEINCLRLINNCIKHNNSKAGRELANAKESHYKEREEIILNEENIKKYNNVVYVFIEELLKLLQN